MIIHGTITHQPACRSLGAGRRIQTILACLIAHLPAEALAQAGVFSFSLST
jgi:hypothetical protein